MFTLTDATETPNSRSNDRMVRHTARCGRCGNVASIVGRRSFGKFNGKTECAIFTEAGALVLMNARAACTCGNTAVPVKAVEGRVVPEHKCDARCVNSKGHVCDCSCGGKNHGSGYSI